MRRGRSFLVRRGIERRAYLSGRDSCSPNFEIGREERHATRNDAARITQEEEVEEEEEAWIGSVRFGWKVCSRSPCNTRLTSWILGNARSLSVRREERRPREAWTEADARVLPRGYGRPTITYSRVWLWYLTRNTVPRSRASPSLSLSLALSLLLSLSPRASCRRGNAADGSPFEAHQLRLQRCPPPLLRVES